MTRRVKWRPSTEKSSGIEDNATVVATVEGKKVYRTITPFRELIVWADDSDEWFPDLVAICLGKKKLSVEGDFLPYAITTIEDGDLSSSVKFKFNNGDTVLVRG